MNNAREATIFSRLLIVKVVVKTMYCTGIKVIKSISSAMKNQIEIFLIHTPVNIAKSYITMSITPMCGISS
jgi:hypothetical protein